MDICIITEPSLLGRILIISYLNADCRVRSFVIFVFSNSTVDRFLSETEDGAQLEDICFVTLKRVIYTENQDRCCIFHPERYLSSRVMAPYFKVLFLTPRRAGCWH